jgi:predicted DNA binding protein
MGQVGLPDAPSMDGRRTTAVGLCPGGAVLVPMTLWEVSVRAQYDYPFIALSRELPDTPISMWCIWDRELLQVPRIDPETTKEVERAIRKSGSIVDEWVDSRQGGRIFLLKCTCERHDSIWNIASANEVIDTPPVVFRDGWGYFRVLSLDEKRTRGFVQALRSRGPTELIRKRELPLSALPHMVWIGALFGDLTERQTSALLAAQRRGYYTSPRQVTTEEIAGSIGLSRTTYEEHLRKAENRIIAAIVPYLQLFATANHPASSMPLKQTLVEPGRAVTAAS